MLFCRHVFDEATSQDFPVNDFRLCTNCSPCPPEYLKSQSTVLVNNKCQRAINLFYFSFATASSSSLFIKSFSQVLYSNIWKYNSPAGAAGGGGIELDSGTTAGSGTGAGATGSMGG